MICFIEIVSPSNSSHDYILKLNLYANAGVREYWIVDPYKERIFVYRLEQEHFEVETYTFHDCIPAGIYADLQIDFPSLPVHAPFSECNPMQEKTMSCPYTSA